MTSNVNRSEYKITMYLWDSLPSHPAAAAPPCDITANRDPPNATVIKLQWTKPTTGAITGYMIYYWADGNHSNGTVSKIPVPAEPTWTYLNVKSTELVYVITIVTLTSMLPSKPSLPFYSKT